LFRVSRSLSSLHPVSQVFSSASTPVFGDIDQLAILEGKPILSNVWIIQKLGLETAEGLTMLNGLGKPISDFARRQLLNEVRHDLPSNRRG
jgi:hypothetical protein